MNDRTDQTVWCAPVHIPAGFTVGGNDVPITIGELLDRKPLALLITVGEGTKAVPVFEAIKELIRQEGDTRFTCKVGSPEGVFLDVTYSKEKNGSFTPKFENRDGVYYMFVGGNMPQSMVKRAAAQMFSAIKKGNAVDASGKIVEYAFGIAPETDPDILNDRREKRHKRKGSYSGRPEAGVQNLERASFYREQRGCY